MKRIKILLKYFLGNSFNNASNGIKNKNLSIIFYILILFGLSAPIAGIIDELYPIFSEIGQEGYLVSLIFLIGSLVVLFLGIYDIMDSFFFSQDIDPIRSLPFKSSEIMIAKFLTCLIDMYIYLAIIILPLITFGMDANLGFTYFLMMIPVYLVSPIVVIIFCILITMFLMSFINISKYQNAFKIIFGCLGIIIMIGIYSLNSIGLNQENIANSLNQNNGLLTLANNIFITNIFSAKALIYSNSAKGIMNLGILIFLSALILIIAYTLGKILYKKILNNRNNVYSEKKNILKDRKGIAVVKNSKLKTLVIRELRTILREPSNFINCVVMILYMPIFLFIFILRGKSIDMFPQRTIDLWVVTSTYLATSLTVIGNAVAATALSREGKDILVSKYIPVDYKTQLKSKIIVCFIVNSLAILIGLCIVIYLKASPLAILLSLIIQILTVITISLANMLLDYSSPKLNWVDAKNLYSKNFKPLIIMLIALITGAANLILITTDNILIIFLVDFIFLSLVMGVIYKILLKVSLKTYRKDLKL